MFLPRKIEITHILSNKRALTSPDSASLKKGLNRLSVLVYPPDYLGQANSGQGGDHEIARNGAIMQFSAGWVSLSSYILYIYCYIIMYHIAFHLKRIGFEALPIEIQEFGAYLYKYRNIDHFLLIITSYMQG
jgi:hypothetical protein